MRHGNVFVISAPSGAGKSSLIKALCQKHPDMQLSISHTTRPPRNTEQNGIDYYFVSNAEFEQMLKKNQFIEHATVYGNYYGTNRNTIEQFIATGQDLILEIDYQGAQQVRNLMPDAILIYIMPPNIEALAIRLTARNTDSPEIIKQRLAAAINDMKHAHEFDHVIINDDFNVALHHLYSIIRDHQVFTKLT